MHDYRKFFVLVALAVTLVCQDQVRGQDEPRRLPPVAGAVQPASAASDSSDTLPPSKLSDAKADSQPAGDADTGAAARADGPESAEEVPALLAPTEELSWYEWVMPTHWHMPSNWESSFEVGMDGSEGDSDTLTLRGGANFNREVDWSKLRMELGYVRGSTFSEETKHNAKLDVNHDWLFQDSPWTAFGKMWLVYNEFTDYHTRLTLNTGAGYMFIDNDTIKLKGQLGAGASRRFRGLDRRWRPEAVMGMEYDHQLSKRQKLHGEVNYLPVWSDFNDYRVRTEASWQVLLDEETNMSLKLRVTDRYEGSSNPSSPNIIHYSMLLLWKL